MSYFSDREKGPRHRLEEEVPPITWGGVVSLITTLIANGSFGLTYPEACPDGTAIIGTNADAMKLAIKAEIPDLQRREKRNIGWGGEEEMADITVDYWPLNPSQQPDTHTILDLIEFCYHHVAEPSQQVWYSFFKHHHLSFDREKGQSKFRETINLIFSRNGLVYELLQDGQIIRTAPPILENLMRNSIFDTSDVELDDMLATACNKFLNRDAKVHRESLEKLWDAWERIKTLLPGKDKKDSAEKLLNMAAPEGAFREMLNNEAITLTSIGNSFQIRHSETDKTSVNAGKHIDYLFHRLFSFIYLLLVSLKESDRSQSPK